MTGERRFQIRLDANPDLQPFAQDIRGGVNDSAQTAGKKLKRRQRAFAHA